MTLETFVTWTSMAASIVSLPVGLIAIVQSAVYYKRNLAVRDEISRLIADLDARLGQTDLQAKTAVAIQLGAI